MTATQVQRTSVEPDLVLLDLDGVVYRGAAQVPGAVPALREFARTGLPYAFLTNNASRSADVVAAQLREFGVPADLTQVLTSAQACARELAETLPTGAAVGVLGSRALSAAIAGAGLAAVPAVDLPMQYPGSAGVPSAIAMGFSADTTVADVQRAIAAVRQGARFFATNPDPSVPQESGDFPGNGTYTAIVEHFAGVTPQIAGKPEPVMPRSMIDDFGASAAVMVGDRCATDIAAGNAAGCTTALVLSGVDDVHAALAASPAARPDRIIACLADLLTPMPTVEVADADARCGQATATLDGARLVTSGPDELAVHAALALVAAHPEVEADSSGLPRRFETAARHD